MQDFVHQQYVSFPEGKIPEASPAWAELRRFGLDKGADRQVVDARSLAIFEKKNNIGIFFSHKKTGWYVFPIGRDHIILPYLCEYHVISWCISPTLFLFVGSYGEVKVYHFFHSFSKEAYDSSLEKKPT